MTTPALDRATPEAAPDAGRLARLIWLVQHRQRLLDHAVLQLEAELRKIKEACHD